MRRDREGVCMWWEKEKYIFYSMKYQIIFKIEILKSSNLVKLFRNMKVDIKIII